MKCCDSTKKNKKEKNKKNDKTRKDNKPINNKKKYENPSLYSKPKYLEKNKNKEPKDYEEDREEEEEFEDNSNEINETPSYSNEKEESFKKIQNNFQQKDTNKEGFVRRRRNSSESIQSSNPIYDVKNIVNKKYGFINNRNNCYLNSSLQLLTRIKELVEKITFFQNENISKNSVTKGRLCEEFKYLIDEITNDKNDKNIVDPSSLKKALSLIDKRYLYDNQEDVNEFISNFIDGLLGETCDGKKKYNPNIDKTNMNEYEREEFQKFENKFYSKIGNSFLLDLFYGVLRTKKFCNCKEIISIRYNPYNMLELPIYDLADNDNMSLIVNIVRQK